MAANNSPIFGLTPRCAIGQLSAANNGLDGTGTIVTVLSAGANGTLITSIRLIATSTTTAGKINLFINDGGTSKLFASVVVAAITLGAGTKGWDFDVPLPGPIAYAASAVVNASVSLGGLQGNGLLLPSGYSLRASTVNAETFNVVAVGLDY